LYLHSKDVSILSSLINLSQFDFNTALKLITGASISDLNKINFNDGLILGSSHLFVMNPVALKK
jgi:hypothetical protein